MSLKDITFLTFELLCAENHFESVCLCAGILLDCMSWLAQWFISWFCFVPDVMLCGYLEAPFECVNIVRSVSIFVVLCSSCKSSIEEFVRGCSFVILNNTLGFRIDWVKLITNWPSENKLWSGNWTFPKASTADITVSCTWLGRSVSMDSKCVLFLPFRGVLEIAERYFLTLKLVGNEKRLSIISNRVGSTCTSLEQYRFPNDCKQIWRNVKVIEMYFVFIEWT